MDVVKTKESARNRSKILIISASVLWAFWGIFHMLPGGFLIAGLDSLKGSISEVVQIDMMGDKMPYYPLDSLKESAFNNIWFGLVVLIGGIFGFKQKVNAIYLCTIVAGFAQLGYLLFLVLPGKAPMLGVVITFLVAIACILGLVGIYMKKKENL